MPVYNAEKYLPTAIESILAQTYANFEFIIINDGSIDDSEKIILSYQDSRIRYLKNDKNIKLIATLNKGIELANGELIARMDADDIALPDMLRNAVQAFNDSPYASVINQLDYELDDEGKHYWKRFFFKQLSSDSLKISQLFTTQILHPGIVIKTNILKQYKYSTNEEALHREDFDLWIRLLKDNHYIKVLSSYAIYHRRAIGSITNSKHDKNPSIGKQLKKYIEYYNGRLSDKAINYFCYNEYNSILALANLYTEISTFIESYIDKHHLTYTTRKELREWLHLLMIYKGIKGINKKNISSSLLLINLILLHPSILFHTSVVRSIFNMALIKLHIYKNQLI